MPTPKLPFNLCEFVPACKKQLIPSVHSWDKFKLSPETRLATPIFDNAQLKKLDPLLIFVNLYQHAKNEAVSLICSEEIIDWKTLQSDWLIKSWSISFHYKTNSVKINDQIFFFNSKNPIFGLFPRFLGQKFFQKNLALSNTTLSRLLAPCQNSEKSNDPIPRKHPDSRKTEGWTDPRIIGPFRLLQRVQQLQLQ